MKRALIFITLWLSLLPAVAMAGDCDGTPGSDIINCPTNPTNPDAEVDGDLGDDQITVPSGVSVEFIDADGGAAIPGNPDPQPTGNGGNDTIIINGTVTRSVNGDYVIGNGGNDTITINGTVTNQVRGDTVIGNGGNDTITNNGTIGGDVWGDYVSGNGGNDTVTNNGTINGSIYGDVADGNGGNDTLINGGRIDGQIDAGGGDDQVILREGSDGGANHYLAINGNAGRDKLIFNIPIYDESEFNALAAALAAASPLGGSVIIRGQTYDWVNFEELVNLLQVGWVTVIFDDGRINRSSKTSSFSAVYCEADGGVRVWGINPQGQGYFLFAVNRATIEQIATTAITAHAQIIEQDGFSLWALIPEAGQEQYLLFHHANGDFLFSMSRCKR